MSDLITDGVTYRVPTKPAERRYLMSLFVGRNVILTKKMTLGDPIRYVGRVVAVAETDFGTISDVVLIATAFSRYPTAVSIATVIRVQAVPD